MSKKGKQPAKQVNPIVSEFQSCCKTVGFNDDEVITELCQAFNASETSIRVVHKNITPQLGKALLRLFQRYQKLQSITLYACVSLDPVFLKQLSNDLVKNPLTQLLLDYSPIQRDAITPFLSLPNLELLSLRGNQCLSPYDYVSGAPSYPFPASLNLFFNQLTTSNLKILNLYACHIGDTGAIALAHTLYFNTNLKCLCLSRNRIGDDGAIALAQALSFYPLSENEIAVVDRFVNEESKQKISDEGGSLLKKKGKGKAAPKKPPPKPSRKGQQTARTTTERLHSFDPAAPIMAAILTKWNTVITNESGVRVLPGNNTLSTLLLDENQITGTGAQHLAEMLNVNHTLVNFTLYQNPEVDPAQIAALERNSLQTNTPAETETPAEQ